MSTQLTLALVAILLVFTQQFFAVRQPLMYQLVSCRGGEEFARSCSNTLEPEDVTVGVVVGMSNHHIEATAVIITLCV